MFYKNKKFSTLILMLPVLALFFAACNSQEKKEATATSNQQSVKPASYKTEPVHFINPEYEISLPAELEPYEQVAVYAKVPGFVKKLYVDRGSRVHKGQLLAVLEAPEMTQKYLSDKSSEQKVYSDYLYAKQAYDRMVDASATTGAVAAIELDRAKTAMESAKSAYKSSKAGTAGTAQLQNYLRITAPFAGIIMEKKVSVGALAGAGSGQPLFMMAQENRLRLTLSLPEKHAASIRQEMQATFTISSQPGIVFNTTLSRTSGLLSQQDRSLTLEFDVDNSSGKLQGGDYAQVKLKLQRKVPSYWVNTKSVLNNQMGTFVLTLNDKVVRRIPVKEGIRSDSLTEIFGNLSQQDHIILKPSEEIKEGKIN